MRTIGQHLSMIAGLWVVVAFVMLPTQLSGQNVTPPKFTTPPRVMLGSSIYSGTTVTFLSNGPEAGTSPMTYRWNFNGQPMGGQTGLVLYIFNASPADVGSYTLTATNSAGSATSPPAVLSTVVPPPPGVDATFVASLAVSSSSTPPLLVFQPDGKILVGGPYTSRASDGNHAGLTRLNADGSEDASFHIGSGVGGGNVTQLLLQPDGKIVVAGTFTSMSGTACPGIVRLNQDGTIDSSFQIDPAAYTPGVPLAMLPDGRLLVFNTSVDRTALVPMRLMLNGTIDPTFQTYEIPVPAKDTLPGLGSYNPAFQDRDAVGRIAVGVGADNFADNHTLVFRIQPDGTLDSTFSVRWLFGGVQTLKAVGNKIAYYTWHVPPSPMVGNYAETVGRLNEDGTDDLSFQKYDDTANYNSGPPASPYFNTVSFSDSGEVLWITTFGGEPSVSEIRHLDSAGNVVTGNQLRLDSNGTLITLLRILPDGRIFAAGSFSTLDGVATAGVAQLKLSGETYATQLANLSIRTRAGTGDQTLIAGFVVGGTSGSKPVLVRGIGPGLSSYGVDGILTDPHLSLYRGSTLLAANDDWDASLSSQFAAVGAFPLASSSKDAALEPTLGPGVYSLQVAGASTTTGVALAEIYDAGPVPLSAAEPRLTNLSGRAQVGAGADALIAGFVVRGTGIKHLLIRGIGPALATYGVSGVLAHPQLAVYRGSDLIGLSIGTSPEANRQAIIAGAFSLPADTQDTALDIDLPPGVYSAQVRSQDGNSGVALVEIYEVP